MPRPNPLPRRPPADPTDAFPAVPLVLPPVRPLAAVNATRPHKSLFDVLQLFLSFREGRALQQCEVFGTLLDIALKSEDPRLEGFHAFGSDNGGR